MESPEPPQVPFALVVPTVYGQMIVNRNDINQTNALFKTGHAVDHQEVAVVANILRAVGAVTGSPADSLVAVDVGANFGTYTLGLAQVVGARGKVHSFEPQRLIFQMLCGSVALNSLTNVHVHNVALGDSEGRVEIPQFDYTLPLNFGSIEFGSDQREPLTQARGNDPARAEFVPLTTIDRFELDRLHMMKIDAEGMETQVIAGAAQTIRRCRPALYVEFIKSDKAGLRRQIADLGYAVYENKINFLCIPSELTDRIRVNEGPAASA